jgi:modulator of FtsH protease
MDGWENFFVAQAGASAALAGLIFVSVSISLPKILASAQLPDRAFQALVVLLQILVISSLMLVPRQPLVLVGAEVLAIGFAVWIMVVIFDIRSLRAANADYRRRAAFRTGLSQLAAALYVVAGGVIASEGSAGFYCLVAAIICSFAIAMLDAWVLLVEINR